MFKFPQEFWWHPGLPGRVRGRQDDGQRPGFLRKPKQIYEALLEHGPLDKVRLRRAARLTSDSAKSRVDRCPGAEPRRTAGFCQGKSQRRWLFPVELQVGLKVLPVGVAEAGAWNYAFVYELFQRWFPQVPQQARHIKRALTHTKPNSAKTVNCQSAEQVTSPQACAGA